LTKSKFLLQQQIQKNQTSQKTLRMGMEGTPFSQLANLAASLYRQQMFQQSNADSVESALFMRPHSQAQPKLHPSLINPGEMMHPLGVTNITPTYMDRFMAAGRDSLILNNFLIQNDSRGSTEQSQHQQFQQATHQHMHFAAIAAARA